MNTLGKVLVFLNLVFALLAVGLFAFLRTPSVIDWRDAAERRGSVATVAETDRNAALTTARQALADRKKAQDDLDYKILRSQDEQNALKKQLKNLLGELEQAKIQANTAILNAKVAQAEANRRHEEVLTMAGVVKEREKEVVRAQQASNRSHQQLLKEIEDRRVAVARALALEQQNRVLARKLAALETKGGGGFVAENNQRKSPSYVNPPQADVKGLILKVDAVDRSLVHISLGSDMGLGKDNTLEVYRLKPRPEYLGRLLIVEVYPRSAIARQIREPSRTPPVLRPNDEVASKIQ